MIPTERPTAVFAGLKGILILLLLMLAGLCVTAFISQLIGRFLPLQSREGLLCQSTVQCVCAFIIPALIYASRSGSGQVSLLRLVTPPSRRAVVGVITLFILGMPMLNQIIYWNENMHLPESMSSLEQTLRIWEDTGSSVTSVILDTTSIGGLITGVLVVGILTGFSEEIFFRGALQNAVGRCGVSVHSAIWIAAAIFSFVHFQFFGFVPRLLLGAMFGYLLFWTGSLWIPALAHAINNSIVVVSFWISSRGGTEIDPSSIGVSQSGFPLIFIASTAAVVIFLIFFRKFFFSNQGRRAAY